VQNVKPDHDKMKKEIDPFYNLSRLLLEIMTEQDEFLDAKFKMPESIITETANTLKIAYQNKEFVKDETGAMYNPYLIDEYGGLFEKEIEAYKTKRNTKYSSISTLSGHLTAHDKKAILAVMNLGLSEGQVGKKSYSIKPVGDNTLWVQITLKDRGMIPCPGSALRLSTYSHTFKAN